LAASSTAAASDADRALVRRMAAGDQAALGALYDRYAGVLHALAVRVTGDADDAEEVVEETFWQAWRQAERYEAARGGISTWLLTICRSRAVDRLRARRRVREERLDDLPEPAPGEADPNATPLESAEADEVRRIVARVLAGLPAEQRETLEMAYFRGMSQSEIAAATGQPLGTVKTRARLALRKLRDALAVLREDGR
jgi:RNA polymerase sigma-70 factor (ECF subfamily)